MPSPSELDKRYLELHGSKWRVVVNVPKELHEKLGRKLRQSLNTDSLREANRLKWDVVADMKQQIYEAGHPEEVRLERMRASLKAYSREVLREEAEHIRTALQEAGSEQERDEIRESIGLRTEQILGKPTDYDEQTHTYFYDQERADRAGEYAGLAQGKLVPVDEFHAKFMGESGVKKRTLDDDMRSMGLLKTWCEREKISPYLHSITKKMAVKFCDDLPGLKPGTSPVTLNKVISRLSVYWSWLEGRHEVEDNVWRGRRLREPRTTDETKERPFLDDEMKALLLGDAPLEMHDLMRIGALSGARLDAIVCLKVGDCQDDVFVFKPQKSETGKRLCPIHPDLKEIVERRTKGKQPDDDLFPEWPGPQNPDSLRERSFKASSHFTEYRRRIGVDDQLKGHRRSRINFHSFRRWFITKAEQADQPEHLIAAVVGHKRKGITLGTYSSGPLLAQARRVVESVKLPDLKAPAEDQRDGGIRALRGAVSPSR